MSRVPRIAWMAAALLCFASPIHAQLISYSVLLDGPSEAPPNASPGTGAGFVDYNPTLHTLHVNVSFSGLLGTVTASHIHAATVTPFTGTAGVATPTPTFPGFPSGVTSGSYDNTLDLTLATSWNAAFITANGGTPGSAETAFASAMATGRAYWNIHSSVVPAGEIRGFLVAVPEPSTVALIGMGVVGFGAYAWSARRRRDPKLRRA